MFVAVSAALPLWRCVQQAAPRGHKITAIVFAVRAQTHLLSSVSSETGD